MLRKIIASPRAIRNQGLKRRLLIDTAAFLSNIHARSAAHCPRFARKRRFGERKNDFFFAACLFRLRLNTAGLPAYFAFGSIRQACRAMFSAAVQAALRAYARQKRGACSRRRLRACAALFSFDILRSCGSIQKSELRSLNLEFDKRNPKLRTQPAKNNPAAKALSSKL